MILLDSDVMIDLLHTFNQKHYRFMAELQTIQPYEKLSGQEAPQGHRG